MRDLTKFVGIKFKDKGIDPAGGLDCWGLARHFYACELGITLPDYFALYNSALNIDQVSAAITRAIPEWQNIGKAFAFGDVLVFRVTHAPWHTAVAVGGGMMLHTGKTHGSILEPIDALRWRDRFFGAYRWKS